MSEELQSFWSLSAVGVETYFLFFVIALLYSSVGFGGGSSYQAWLALLGIPITSLRFLALICNLSVVTSGSHLFWQFGYLRLKKTLPLVLFSVPAAAVGGSIQLTEQIYFFILACSLTVGAVFLFFLPSTSATSGTKNPNKKFHKNKMPRIINYKKNHVTVKNTIINKPVLFYAISLLLGAGLGFLAGLVGIGGGIFLAPILYLLRWDRARVIAATASFFIFVNSIAGLAGQISQNFTELLLVEFPANKILFCIGSVFLGGQLGTRFNIHLFSATIIKKITAIFMLVVAIRLFLKIIV